MRRPVPFGKYLLLDRISVGGMAEVFKAKSFGVQGFEKVIAIKRILPAMTRDEEFIKMFIDEAKIAGQLTHANIGHIHELGRIDTMHFIAMEYIWGRDLLQLQNRLKRQGKRLSVMGAVFIIMKVCEGLHYAHKKRDVLGNDMEIVHRDCSPQNIVVSFEGEVKLIDFGIARAASRHARTNAGVLKGKFAYMSPEQVRGLPLDRRSDIFSLGTVLYEVLTGERLFASDSDFTTLEKVRNAVVDRSVLAAAGVPEAVQAIVCKALSRSPDERYAWCSEMRDDLRAFMQSTSEIYTQRSLAKDLQMAFASELARESAQMESYSSLRLEDFAGQDPAAESSDEAEILVAGDTPSPILLTDALAPPPPPMPMRVSGGGMHSFEDERPTEIFGEISGDLELEDDDFKTPERSRDGLSPSVIANLSAASPTGDYPVLSESGAGSVADFYRNANNGAADALPPPMATEQVPRQPFRLPVTPLRQAGPGQWFLRNRRLLVFATSALVSLVAVVLILKAVVGSKAPAGDPTSTLVVVVDDERSAEVIVDGAIVGQVPPKDALTVEGLPAGTHTLRVQREGLTPCTETIELEESKLRVYKCAFAMQREGKLVIENLRAGDRVVIDGKKAIHVEPGKGIALQAGRQHWIAVTRDEALIKEFAVRLEANESKTVALEDAVAEMTIEEDELADGPASKSNAEAREALASESAASESSASESSTSDQESGESDEAPPTRGSASLLADEPDDVRQPKSGNDGRRALERLTGNELDQLTEDPRLAKKKKSGVGYFTAWTRPWARLHIDGKDTGKVTPIAPADKIALAAGKHRVTFIVGESVYNFSVEIEAGETENMAKILD